MENFKKNTHTSKQKEGFINSTFAYRGRVGILARGGLSLLLTLGRSYTKNDRGCFLGKLKPSRGDYAADQALYMLKAKSYEPNGYNLYNMAGNVSEWTDSYDPTNMFLQ
jgi:hypothetical protein